MKALNLAETRHVITSLLKATQWLWQCAAGLLAANLVIRLVLAVIPPLHIALTAKLVDAVTTVIAQGPSHLGAAYPLLVLQASLLFGASLLNVLLRHTTMRLVPQVAHRMEETVIRKANRLALTFLEGPDYYSWLGRLRAGQGVSGIVDPILQVLPSSVTLIGYLVVLSQFHRALVIGAALLLVPLVLVQLSVKHLDTASTFRQSDLARRASYFMGMLLGRDAAKEVRIFGLTDLLLKRWDEYFWRNVSDQLEVRRKEARIGLTVEAVSHAVTITVLSGLLFLSAQGRLSLGGYVATAQVVVATQAILQAIARSLGQVYKEALIINETVSFLALPEDTPCDVANSSPLVLEKGLQIRNLWFRFPNQAHFVLRGVSLDIHPKEKVAIVGENGCGKTTLVKCMLGLFRSTEGQVLYDGVKLSPSQMRQNVTVVFQDFVRYEMTVRDNIAIGDIKQYENHGAIRQAAEAAGAHPFIEALPNQYETQLGVTLSKGQDLSLGQWQKVALARAFLRDSQILVMDEPTSALDPKAEASLVESVLTAATDKTVVVISHRLGICRQVDRIIVMKHGEVVEQGTHDQLLKNQGEYAQLYHAQARWYV